MMVEGRSGANTAAADRKLVVQLADQVPGLDVPELRYSRGGSDLGLARQRRR
jgi:hypothetical protein